MIETPFLTGKQYRDDELGESAVRQANWRYCAFGAMGLAGLVMLLLFYVVSLPRQILKIVEVTTDSGAAQMTQADFKSYVPPETTYTKQLREDVEVLRKITTDKEDMRRQHVRTRTRMTLQGKKQYNQYEQERKPFEQKDPVTVDLIGTPLHDGGLTWDIRWRETTYGHQLSIETWRGKFTFLRTVPQDKEEEAATPLGIFLDTWSWSKE